ncbi:MAG: GTPase HflX, partial [Lachnospiraceae bacterium]|nr:GTPase HflX [Lachnospiraceae bacterium]
MYENKEITERVILVAVRERDGDDTENSLTELAELANTAGAEVAGTLIQSLDRANISAYLGSGKLRELKDLIWELDATGVICDDELKPMQMKNMEEALDIKVMDRTLLILDIFASRAATREGKLQVELAQLKYSLTR